MLAAALHTASSSQAVDLHDKVLRQYLSDFGGYEVTTEGDAFLVAFHDPAEAVGYCLTVQLALQGEASSAQHCCSEVWRGMLHIGKALRSPMSDAHVEHV
jgi:class 3 adenylate cyclase